MNLQTMGIMSASGEFRPEDIEPDYSAPWMGLLGDGVGWLVGTFLIVVGALVEVGVLIWRAGKFGGSSGAQDVGVTFVLWVVIGAIVLGGIGGIIAWASGLDVFGADW